MSEETEIEYLRRLNDQWDEAEKNYPAQRDAMVKRLVAKARQRRDQWWKEILENLK